MSQRPDTLSRQNVPTEKQPASEYIRHPDGIHEIIYNEVSREAVDQYMTHLDNIMSITPKEQTLRLLSNGTKVIEMQPITYMMSRFRGVMQKHPQRPAVRVAILYGSVRFIDLVNGLFRMFVRGRDGMRFFKAEERDEAIAWLHES